MLLGDESKPLHLSDDFLFKLSRGFVIIDSRQVVLSAHPTEPRGKDVEHLRTVCLVCLVFRLAVEHQTNVLQQRRPKIP